MVGIRGAVRRFARGAPGNALRCLFYRLAGVTLGEQALIGRDVAIGHGVSIGRSTRMQPWVIVRNDTKIGDEVKIGSGASVGPRVCIGNGAIVGGKSILVNSSVGDHSFVEYGVVVTGEGDNRITIGKHCYIGIYCVLDHTGEIEIGDYVHIAGPTTGIWTHTSVYQCLAGDPLEEITRKVIARVKIESNVWIGGNTTVYPGVTIGHHSIILPNSVVNEDVAPYSIVGGVPAKLKRQIKMGDDEMRFVTVKAEGS